MSEVRSRPSGPRGRGTGRVGRGGHMSRSARGPRPANGDSNESATGHSIEEEGELGELKKMYSSKLTTIKEMFPDWTDEDIVFALQETDGNLEGTIDRISEGNISQWGEVKKKSKDRPQPKSKDAVAGSADASHTATRGGRGRGGIDGPRGRGRGSERGRGAGRGGRGTSTLNGSRDAAHDKAPVDTAPVTDGNNTAMVDGATATPAPTADTDSAALDASWENITASEAIATPAAEPPKPSLKPDGTRSWASMFNKPVPVPVSKQPSQELVPEAPLEQLAPPPPHEDLDMPALPPPIPVEAINPNLPNTPPSPSMVSSEQAVDLTPPKDQLTETNLEQVLDASGPPNSGTAASTVASTVDQRVATGTPLQTPAQATSTRPPMGGYATTAYKATGMPGRSASYQRKILEQREAVVMPGKHAVDRAAVQFGSMGLNGTNEDLDLDDDREEPETRTQPPQHSPIAPKATLPPPGQSPQASTSEALPTPRPAPGLPPVNPQFAQQATQSASADQGLPQQPSQPLPPYSQFGGRFGPQQTLQEPSAPVQKPYEPFGSQIQQPHHAFDSYSSSSQGQTSAQNQAAPHPTGVSSAPQDVSSYYTSDSQRQAYQNYYANYGQQPQPTAQEQNRTPSAFGTSGADQGSQHATSQPQQQPLGRYAPPNDLQNSGSSTPNPSLPSHAQQSQLLHQQPQPHGQSSAQHGAYPYGQPYYPGNYYQPYMNQFGYGGSQGGYGGPFAGGAGKQGLYGQPHQGYGISPQSSYDQHASSPANPGGFGGQQQQHQPQSAPGREGAASANMSNYQRNGSAQPSEHQQQYPGASSGYGGVSDTFGRSPSGLPGQNHGFGHQQSGQHGGSEDALRGFGESKGPGGPSPAPGARPGSAVNNMHNQSGLPASQTPGQHSYGGYPGHLSHQMHGQQGSQYGAGPGSLGGHQQSAGQGHQGSGYGGYNSGFPGSYYGSNRGGWGANYGH